MDCSVKTLIINRKPLSQQPREAGVLVAVRTSVSLTSYALGSAVQTVDIILALPLENLGGRNISTQHHGVAERAGLHTRQAGVDLSVTPAFALWPDLGPLS